MISLTYKEINEIINEVMLDLPEELLNDVAPEIYDALYSGIEKALYRTYTGGVGQENNKVAAAGKIEVSRGK